MRQRVKKDQKMVPISEGYHAKLWFLDVAVCIFCSGFYFDKIKALTYDNMVIVTINNKYKINCTNIGFIKMFVALFGYE